MPKVHQFPYNKETGLTEFTDLVICAVKEAEHAYLITGNPQGIRSDLTVEVWTEGVAYLETIGVTESAHKTKGHVDKPNLPQPVVEGEQWP